MGNESGPVFFVYQRNNSGCPQLLMFSGPTLDWINSLDLPHRVYRNRASHVAGRRVDIERNPIRTLGPG